MKKETIEISREEHPHRYAKIEYLHKDLPEILDKLIELTNAKTDFPRLKVYRHIVRYEEEKVGELGLYDFSNWPFSPEFERPKIDKCELVCYLDVYYQ